MYQMWKKSIHKRSVFGWLKVVFVKGYEDEEEQEEKCEENWTIFKNTQLHLVN